MEYGDKRFLNWEVPWNMETRELITGRYHGIGIQKIFELGGYHGIWRQEIIELGGTMKYGDKRS